MHLVVDIVLLAFFVHLDDALFPLPIGAGSAESDVGNGAGIGSGNALPYGLDQDASLSLIVVMSSQLGILFDLLEEEIGRAGHL